MPKKGRKSKLMWIGIGALGGWAANFIVEKYIPQFPGYGKDFMGIMAQDEAILMVIGGLMALYGLMGKRRFLWLGLGWLLGNSIAIWLIRPDQF